ncbi:MAG TPA: rubrerythrin family protein [Dehalococcoidia bacterium]|nr:rubrerythrin family protein [Dehalococcoidia bacterium]
MSNTMDNLQAAFAGESQANRRYLFFADKAVKEGQPGIARLFRATAEAETIHARNHLEVMGEIGSTADNLEAAIAGENYEFSEMYPGFIEQAKSEGNKRAETSFVFANKVEQIHHGLFQKTLQTLKAGQKIKDEPYFVCQVCGYTVAGVAPDRCPVCGAPRGKFMSV